MSIMKEAAIFVGDTVTAPIRKKMYELRTGKEAAIRRIEVFSDEGEYSRSHIEWFIVAKSKWPSGNTL